ncbi:MAG TPA: hypothetical protein VGP76_06855 [Planctomycetaceae bacterium]|jgi:hypothetical protein|nr:hypothetical protein [Planctomycetaceae bacterium]
MVEEQKDAYHVVGNDTCPSGSQLPLGLLIGALITPVTLFLAIASTGAGHGDYKFFRIFYPVEILLMSGEQSRFGFEMVVVLAAAQFPAYFGIIGAFKGRFRALVTCLIAVIHSLAMYLCFYPRGPFG